MNALRPPAPHALIVDHCPDTADALALLLRRWGYSAAVAHDGPSALALASATLPAAAVLDVGLPGMDGCELAGRLRRLPGLGRALRIGITGRRREEDIRRFFGAGFDRHLPRPCDPEELRRVLDGRLAARPARLSRPEREAEVLNAAPNSPRPGQLVRWRDTRHARALGWLDALGPGPFEVARVVDHAVVGLPPGVVLKTRFGEREINTVWLAPAGPQPSRN